MDLGFDLENGREEGRQGRQGGWEEVGEGQRRKGEILGIWRLGWDIARGRGLRGQLGRRAVEEMEEMDGGFLG